MNSKHLLFLLVILLAAGATFFFLPSDEKQIRRNLTSLAQYCTSTHKEPPIESLKKAALSAKLCSNPCWIEVESFNIARDFSQKEISDHILLMKKRLIDTRFTFRDTVIEFADENRGEIMTTLHLEGKTKDNRFTDAYEINIMVEKSEGDWFFSSFTVVEFIEQ